MKRLCFLCLLLSVSAFAQDGEHYLNSCARMMANNRRAFQRFPFPVSITKGDTLAATALNYRSRAFNYVVQKDYSQAAVWLEKTATRFPKENGNIGLSYLKYFRDYARALRHFEAYDAITPDFDDLIHHNPVSYMEGLAWRGLGNDTKAIALFSKAIDSLAIKHGAEWVNYRHFVSRAVSCIAIQQPEKALVDLDSSLKNFNRSALVQYHRGRALLQLNRLAEARTAFQDASFFYKALRAERTGSYQEDEFNPIYEEEIDQAIAQLKTQTR